MKQSALMLLTYGPLVALVAVWTLVTLTRRPGLIVSAEGLAAIAFVATCAKPMLELLLNPRTGSALGAIVTYDPRVLILAQGLVAVAVASSVAVLASGRRRRLTGAAGAVVLAVWLFAAARLISGALATEQPAFAQDTLIFALTFHAVVKGVPSQDALASWATKVLRIITGVSLASIAVAPDWAFIGAGVTGQYDRLLFGVPRLTGLAPHPGALALLSVIALVIEVSRRRGGPGWRRLGIVMALTCVILTQSRTLWVCTLLALLVLYAARRASGKVILGGGAVTGMLLLAYGGSLLQAAFGGRTGQDLSTISGRTRIWQYSIAEFEQQPLTGYGPAFLNETYRRLYLPATEQQAIHAHNQAMQTLGETGLLGLAALVLLTLALVSAAVRARRVDGGLAVALLAVILVDGFTGVPLRPVGLVALSPLFVLGLIATGSRPLAAPVGSSLDGQGVHSSTSATVRTGTGLVLQ